MTHKRRNALAVVAMSAAAVGTVIGLGVTSAGAAPATHRTAAKTEIRASPTAVVRVKLASAATKTPSTTKTSSTSGSTKTATPATKKGSSKMTGNCPNMSSSSSSSSSTTS